MQGGRAGAWFEEIPSARSNQRACGIVPWTSAEVALFVIRHWLGVRFEGDTLVLRPALYPDSPPVSADCRFKNGRLRIEVNGTGPTVSALVNGIEMQPDTGGELRFPKDFPGGTIILRAETAR